MHRAIPEVNPQVAFEHQERFIRVLVVMPSVKRASLWARLMEV
jgi:hypothetical protein